MGSMDSDVLAMHAALVKAQDEVAEARAETERVRAHARQERMRRQADVARLHESMHELRRLAEGSLEKEREKATAQLTDVLAQLATAKQREHEADELHRRLDTALRNTELAEAETRRLRGQLQAVLELIGQEL